MKANLRSFILIGIIIPLPLTTSCARLEERIKKSRQSRGLHEPSENLSSTGAYEIWQKIGLQGLPIGYATIRVRGNVVEENLVMTVTALGNKREVKTKLMWEVDRGFSFRSLTFELETEHSRNFIRGQKKSGKLWLQIGNTKRELELRDETIFTGASYILILEDKLKSGKHPDSIRLLYFDPSVLRVDFMEIRHEGKEGALTVFSKHFGGIRSRVFFSPYGKFVREEGPAGIELVKIEEGELSSPPVEIDLIFLTSTRAYGNIPTARRENISYVKLMIEGVESIREFPPYQRVEKKNGRLFVELMRTYMYQLSVPPSSLLPEPLVESDASEIKRTALDIIRSRFGTRSPSAEEIARAISDWVYKNVEKTSVMSIPSALEVLRSQKGDCNEHAVLSVALLRALGIPARVAFGLAYDSGSFFYHAWVEFHDGQKWIAFDPTWGQFPSDILRLKLGDGNVQEWIDILKYVGKIKITFLEWR